ncbi:DUF6192 family protein [Streptomyces niveus]|uniref:DUF6192 family protein n=1 Tax=Streptomyces niveus TaxID=193462 RepID=UPI0036DF1A94
MENDEERFAPPLTPPEGKTRWTADDASRRVGNQVETPVTPQEKITAIHSRTQDGKVAAAVTNLLRRPDVAFKAMSIRNGTACGEVAQGIDAADQALRIVAFTEGLSLHTHIDPDGTPKPAILAALDDQLGRVFTGTCRHARPG